MEKILEEAGRQFRMPKLGIKFKAPGPPRQNEDPKSRFARRVVFYVAHLAKFHEDEVARVLGCYPRDAKAGLRGAKHERWAAIPGAFISAVRRLCVHCGIDAPDIGIPVPGLIDPPPDAADRLIAWVIAHRSVAPRRTAGGRYMLSCTRFQGKYLRWRVAPRGRFFPLKKTDIDRPDDKGNFVVSEEDAIQIGIPAHNEPRMLLVGSEHEPLVEYYQNKDTQPEEIRSDRHGYIYIRPQKGAGPPPNLEVNRHGGLWSTREPIGLPAEIALDNWARFTGSRRRRPRRQADGTYRLQGLEPNEGRRLEGLVGGRYSPESRTWSLTNAEASRIFGAMR